LISGTRWPDVRAVEVARFGGPDVLEVGELPDPAPGPGQVVVTASSCDVLFVDTMIRSGRGTDFFPIRPPYVPGNGVGGTVAALGDGVDHTWLGRPVVAHTGGTGGYAELAAVDLGACGLVPDGVDLLDAAAVLHDGTTALRVLEKTAPEEGEWVLVVGAAGGMGILLVQLLAARGANVVGAARGSTKRDVVSGAGATATIDYGEAAWTDAVLPMDHPFRLLDNVVVTPHVGYVTEHLFRTAWQRMAEDVAAYLTGSPIRVVTDPSDCPPMAPQ
jgi:NADPH2:quinone reductase